MRSIIVMACLAAVAINCAAAPAKKVIKPAAAKTAAMPPKEQLSCRTGPNDEQARLTVVVVKGRPMEFAYYSRLGTRVCSIYGKRGDAFTKWKDANGKAEVALLEGNAELDYVPGRLTLTFAGVDRMQYCGMYGRLNGVVEVAKGKAECKLEHIFESGVDSDTADDAKPDAGGSKTSDVSSDKKP